MKPIDQLVLDIALALCAISFAVAAGITGPGAGWFFFALAVLLVSLIRVLSTLHAIVPGGFGFADGGIVDQSPPISQGDLEEIGTGIQKLRSQVTQGGR